MAARTEPAAPASAAPAPAAKRRLLTLLIWGGAVVAVLGTATLGWMLMFRSPSPEAKEAKEGPPAHIFKVGTLVVNVAETNGRRYLRATVELGVASATDGRHLEELRTPLVDAALGVLGATPLEALLDHTKRDALKTALQERLNATAGGAPVREVFFTEFVIQ